MAAQCVHTDSRSRCSRMSTYAPTRPGRLMCDALAQIAYAMTVNMTCTRAGALQLRDA